MGRGSSHGRFRRVLPAFRLSLVELFPPEEMEPGTTERAGISVVRDLDVQIVPPGQLRITHAAAQLIDGRRIEGFAGRPTAACLTPAGGAVLRHKTLGTGE